jgi:hypothetical protein
MDFYEVLAQVIESLQREGRTSYRALRRQFDFATSDGDSPGCNGPRRTDLVQGAVDAEDAVSALETDEEQQREELTWDDSTIKSH